MFTPFSLIFHVILHGVQHFTVRLLYRLMQQQLHLHVLWKQDCYTELQQLDKDTYKRIESLQRRYKHARDRSLCNVPRSCTTGLCLFSPPVTNSATGRLAAESYSKLISPRTGQFKVVLALSETDIIREEGIAKICTTRSGYTCAITQSPKAPWPINSKQACR